MRSCCRCHKEIYDRFYLLADNKLFHFDCLSCEKCFNPLASGSTCFFRDGMVLCKSDYLRMFTAVCLACNQCVTPDSYVHKIRLPKTMNNMNERPPFIYIHPSCLRCFKCQNYLKKGDKYIIKPDHLGIVCLNNECANDFGFIPLNSTINQPTSSRKRGRQSNSSVKVKAEKTQNQFNQM